MYETTGDLNEQHWLATLEADMEMAEMRQAALEREADRKAGNCWHDSGVRFRPVAFYPEQVGLAQGQMFCYDCNKAVADPSGPDCVVCDLDVHNCMGERGVGGEGKYAHDHFVTPPMVLVSVAPEGGF